MRINRIVVYVFLVISSIKSQQLQSEVLLRANQQSQAPFVAFETLFENIPHINQIRSAILNGDTLSLTKLHQTLTLDPSLDCVEKARYTDIVIGLVKTGIWQQNSVIENFRGNLSSARELLEPTQAEVQNLNAQITKLNFQNKRKKLDSTLSQLEQRYNKFNIASDELVELLKKYDSSQRKVQSLGNATKTKRDIANRKRSQLIIVDSQIDIAERRLKKLKDERKDILENLKQSLQFITKSQNQIQQANVRIELYKYEIKNTREVRDNLSSEAISLQIEVSVLKANLQKDERQKTKLFDLLDVKKGELFEIQNLLKEERSLENLKNINVILSGILTKFTDLNIRTYYECFANRQFFIEDPSKSLTGYQVTGGLVRSYLENIYGNRVGLPSYQFTVNLNLTLYDLFVKPLVKPGQFLTTRSFNNRTLSFEGDRTCDEQTANIVSGVGNVVRIEAGTVIVSTFRMGQIKLKVGACTRFESISQNITAGQTMYFRGIVEESSWNVFMITSF